MHQNVSFELNNPSAFSLFLIFPNVIIDVNGKCFILINKKYSACLKGKKVWFDLDPTFVYWFLWYYSASSASHVNLSDVKIIAQSV